LEELNRLQALLVELATAYINLPLENIDDAINASLGKMGAFVEADRAYVFDYDFHRQVCINTHEWCAPEIPPQIANLQAVPLSSVPDWVAAHQRGDTLHIQAVSALNPDCDLRQLLESQEIKSLIAVPMMKGPECLGFVGFDAVARQRRYSEQQKQLLTVFAQILINIRLRRQAEDAARRQHLFQEIVAGMAADFVGITGENVQEKITVTLKRFSTFLEIDRSGILIFSPENETWSVISQWCHREVEPIQERLRKCPDIDWSWIGRRIRRGGPPVHFPDVNALTDEERDEKACLLKLGVKSALFLPLYTSQRLYGMIGFDTVNQPMRWPEDQINGLRVVAQILANAFSSIDARQALVEARATLEQRVEARTRELQTQMTAKETALAQLAAAQSSLLEASRVAGRSEVATEVLHNVGNVLNNVNVSCTLLMDQLRQSRVGNVARVAGLMAEAGDDLARFLAQDQRGRQIPAYLQSLAAALRQEHRTLFTEAETLHDRIEHIKEIVAMQQSYGRVFGVKEKIAPEQLMEDALKLNAGALARHGITVKRRYAPMPPISVDKHAVLQILLNLVNNAKYACTEGGKAEKTIHVSVARHGSHRVRMQVADNGVGIAPENMTRIFQHGFTTRKDGHGFGLHSGALTARDLGGSLSAHSDGPGRGAVFTLELPCQ
jgi:signal transduction histidine kinase